MSDKRYQPEQEQPEQEEEKELAPDSPVEDLPEFDDYQRLLFEAPSHRGIVAGSHQPAAQPQPLLHQNTGGLLPGALSSQPINSTSSSSSSLSSLSAASGSLRVQVGPAPLQVAPSWINETSSFVTDAEPQQLAAALHASLSADPSVQWRLIPTAGELELDGACFPATGSSFGFQVHTWRNDRPGGRLVVELQRRRGCSLSFFAWFRDFVAALPAGLVLGDRWGDAFPEPQAGLFGALELPALELPALGLDLPEDGSEELLPPPPPAGLAPAPLPVLEQETTDALWSMVASPFADLRVQALELLAQSFASVSDLLAERESTLSEAASVPQQAQQQQVGVGGGSSLRAPPSQSSSSSSQSPVLFKDPNLQSHLELLAGVLTEQLRRPDPTSLRALAQILRSLAADVGCHKMLLGSLLRPMVHLATEDPKALQQQQQQQSKQGSPTGQPPLPGAGGAGQLAPAASSGWLNEDPDAWLLDSQRQTLRSSVNDVIKSLEKSHSEELVRRLHELTIV